MSDFTTTSDFTTGSIILATRRTFEGDSPMTFYGLVTHAEERLMKFRTASYGYKEMTLRCAFQAASGTVVWSLSDPISKFEARAGWIFERMIGPRPYDGPYNVRELGREIPLSPRAKYRLGTEVRVSWAGDSNADEGYSFSSGSFDGFVREYCPEPGGYDLWVEPKYPVTRWLERTTMYCRTRFITAPTIRLYKRDIGSWTLPTVFGIINCTVKPVRP